GQPLSTVSRKISQLEDRLGARLLTRTTRRLALTDVGGRYLAASRRVLADLDEAERIAVGARAAPQGRLSITAPVVFGRLHVLPLVGDFLRAHAAVDVRLVLFDRVVDLVEEGLDLALRIGSLPDTGMIATRVGAVRRVTVASPAYLRRHGTPATPADLEAHAIVVGAAAPMIQRWQFAVGGRTVVPAIRPRLIVSTAEAAIDAAIAGVGITRVLSYQIVAAVAARRLVRILRDFEAAPVPVSLVYQDGRLLPVTVRAFLDFAVPRLRARLVGKG
ncbi:MAG: LysR substrate-binding domain-containing protein, partial [Alphaproteobacteria bacterium]